MREQDMRLRVERFLRVRLRRMLMPATLGLGLAIGGCNSDGLNTDDGGNPLAKKDAAAKTDAGPVPVPMYIAAVPDAAKEAPLAQPDYMAQMPDAGLQVRYAAVMPDAGGAVAVYTAQFPATS
jgi:hypothetical protein